MGNKLRFNISIFSLFILNGFISCSVQAAEKWIDVHFHIVGDKGKNESFVDAGQRAIRIMDQSNIDKAIIMSPPRPFQEFDIDELLEVQKNYPTRIAILGGGGTLNPMIQESGYSKEVSEEVKAKFAAIAERIISSGAKGFGEIAIHHVSLNPGHGYESIAADGPLLLLLADIAARHNVPIDIHFDPVPETVQRPSGLNSPNNPETFQENISGFERLLAHNRGAKIIWAHAGSDPLGFYTPQLVSALLKKHPNLYCSIRTTYRTNNPMRHPKRGINEEWIGVLKEFPDRFVMGTDGFLTTQGYSGPDGPKVFEQTSGVQRQGVNEVLSHLDSDLAKKIGRDNALRLYRISE